MLAGLKQLAHALFYVALLTHLRLSGVHFGITSLSYKSTYSPKNAISSFAAVRPARLAPMVEADGP